MAHVSNCVIDFLDEGFAQRSVGDVGRLFFRRLRRFGVTALNARCYRSPLDADVREQTYARIAPASCEGVYADQRFLEHNPIPRNLATAVEPMRWTAMRLRTDGERWVVSALREAGFPDGLAIPCHGPNNYLGVMSLAFERLDQVAPEERRAIELASLALHARMRALWRDRDRNPLTALSPRERDCLAFIAEGRSNGQIAAALNVSHTTVATHVANARAKLGARTRAQAVATYLSYGGA